MKNLLFSLIIFFTCGPLISQDTIYIDNKSFEGNRGHSRLPAGWTDCGSKRFPGQTPPDTQPNGMWGKMNKPTDGKSYISLVTRYDDTWESVGQQLSQTLYKGQCYQLSADLSKAKSYNSPTKRNKEGKETFLEPIHLRVWLSDRECGKKQLAYESPLVDHHEWHNRMIKLKPEANSNYINFEAFYKTPSIQAYNGHLLLDNLSDIVKVACE